ncbi:unnamed protein product [Danaus chrysippus]|uniref:(African queen) hypothetical protein n=1 Tax=Danaus chrysippus TaxID=151541 RepID=A0A8J2VT15_9NEOP|nr:unnamed protein product [Danaus chrysippus]
MCELALGVRSRALIPLELSAYFELQPTRVFTVQKAVHVHHGCHCCHCGRGYALALFSEASAAHMRRGESAPARSEHALLTYSGKDDSVTTMALAHPSLYTSAHAKE